MSKNVSFDDPTGPAKRQMMEAAKMQAELAAVQMQASGIIQSSASTAQTVSGANAAGTETTKGIANDMRAAARSS